ncbi:DinB family protein [Dyadobacter sp. CY312]|uniref:DinB family protein n=1 Tax=Dyadobacter sp. CY312 TaxID=2907303 RepID=UPI001F1A4B1F|nr:DinB family protein [Dyadobacter sp. CY312]MCE7039553.1 DinB family protein [Dyadobacter sp. CY312]
MEKQKTEVWQRGPHPGVPSLLQPVAHALLQAREELEELTLPTELLWKKPGGVASVGFHLQHLAGVLDRLYTYAKEQALTEQQLGFLKNEGVPPFENCTYQDLYSQFSKQVDLAIDQLKETDENSLTEVRYVGRARIESTHLGLLFHAAEHSQRHLGQLLVTARILKADLE